MRKVLLLALVGLFLGTACQKSEESAPAPDASASTEASPAAPSDGGASPGAMASPAAP